MIVNTIVDKVQVLNWYKQSFKVMFMQFSIFYVRH